jgi:hypothetical protein
VVLETDCTTPEQLDQVLSWTLGTGSGDFATAPFAAVDAELRRLKEYVGYSIVFSGSRSLHFHFVFSTAHLKNAPVHANAEARVAADQRAESALLHRVHNAYWDHVRDVFVRILNPSISPDEQMRSLTKSWSSASNIASVPTDNDAGLRTGHLGYAYAYSKL